MRFPPLAFLLLITAQAPAADEQSCIILSGVDVEGSEVLSPVCGRELTEAFIGECIDADLTRDVLVAISDYFIENGYITTRPYLREQDISDGRIEVSILPGTVEAVIDSDSGESNSRITGAFLFNGEVLNLRELETSLEMIERVSSVESDFEIMPGSSQGASIVVVKTTQSEPFRVELGANAQTDLDSQLGFQATLDNPLNINDVFDFRINRGEVPQSYQSNNSQELGYSFPLGGYLLELIRSDVSFEQRIQGISDSFVSEGETVSERLRVSKVAVRDQASRLTLAISLKHEDTENFFEDQLIEVSSYKTSQLQLELQQQWFRPWGLVSSYYTFHRGLDSFGARDDDYYVRDDGSDSLARLQFEKHSLGGRFSYYLGDTSWQLDSSLHFQVTDDLLFDSDKLNLGSPHTVRGYSSALSGSNAGYLRGDITRNFQSVVNPPGGRNFTKTISLSFGIDYGEAKCEADNRDSCGEIYGAGIGLVVWDANFSGRLSWGHPLKQKHGGIGDKDRFLLDLRWAL